MTRILRRYSAGSAPRTIGLGLLGLVPFVAIWSIAMLFIDEGNILSQFGPREAFLAFGSLMTTEETFIHIYASLKRILMGMLFAILTGVPLGFLLGTIKLFELTSAAVFQFLRMISPLSWTPLAIILFGVGDNPVYFLIAIGAVWPIALNTAESISRLNRGWLLVSKTLGASRLESFTNVVWPATKPGILLGIRLAVGLSWIILVPAEMLGVDSGLGYYILDTRDRFEYSELIAAIMIIGILGLILDILTRFVLSSPQN
jgi:NitT/TauT family transport system permease protein